MKIEARTRLVAAKADEGAARAYLKSLGIATKAVRSNEDGFISFVVEDARAAAATLSQKLKQRAEVVKRQGMQTWSFNVGPKKRISVTLGKSGSRVTLAQG